MKVNAPDLYELTGAYADAAAVLMDCETDEEYSEALTMVDRIEVEMTEKAASMARVLRNMQALASVRKASADAFEAEAKRMRAKTKAAESFVERIKERVTFAMETAGIEKIRTEAGTWYIAEDISVDVTDPQALPAEFVRSITIEPDKTALKKHIKFTGEIIPGTVTTTKRGARIR